MENASSGTQALPSLGSAVRHHWLTVLMCAALGAALAIGYAAVVPSSYTSTAQALLAPAPGNPLDPEAASGSGTQLTIAMETEAGIVRSPEVATKAAEELGRAAPESGERLGVDVPGATQMVQIEFTAAKPDVATEGAAAFSTAYLTYREGRAEATQQARLETLSDQRDTAQDELRRATGEAAEDGSASYATQEVQLFTDRLAQLNDEISSTGAVSTDPGRIIRPADTPSGANELPASLLVLVGALLGLLLGVFIALFREWRRDLVREDEHTEITGVPVFATLPPNETGLVVGNGVDPAGHEAYRRLRSGVVANGPRPHVLAVTTVDAEGHTSVACSNLAVSLAEARFSVLVVAADPEDRAIERILGVSRTPGLAEVVSDGVPVRDVLVRAAGVSVIPGGSDPLSVRELYAGPALQRLVDSVRDDFDYVVLGAASAGTGDGDAVIAAADSVLLAVTSSRTTHAQVTAALERFARLGIRTLGAVLTPPNESAQGHRRLKGSARERRGSKRAVSVAGEPVTHRTLGRRGGGAVGPGANADEAHRRNPRAARASS